MGGTEPSIREQAQHLLQADLFRRSPRLCELLAFLAEASSAGEPLKESLIGIQLFGREPGYDAKSDPVVRTEIRRLRLKLAEYYATEGARDSVQIAIPKGAYVLELRRAEGTAVNAARPAWQIPAAIAAICVFIVAGVLFFVLRPPGTAQRYAARSPALQDLYLRGRELQRTRLEPKVREAIGIYQRCTLLDPDYVWPYIGIADSYAMLAANSLATPSDVLPKAESAALRAIELAPDLADVHLSLGYIRYCQWDWRKANNEYAKARTLNPALFLAFYRSAIVSVALGRFDEALASLAKAKHLDPFSPFIDAALSETYYYKRDYVHAADAATRLLSADPAAAHLLLGKALWWQGHLSEARAHWAHLSDVPASPFEERLRPLWMSMGEPDKGRALLRDILRDPGPDASPWVLAEMSAAFGDTPAAWDWLDKAVLIRQPDVVCVQWDPVFDSMRADARYSKLVTRLGQPASDGNRTALWSRSDLN